MIPSREKAEQLLQEGLQKILDRGATTPKRRRIARKKSQPRVVILTRKKRMCWGFCTTSGGHLA